MTINAEFKVNFSAGCGFSVLHWKYDFEAPWSRRWYTLSGFSYSPICICIWICVCNHVFVWRWSIRRRGISRRRDTDVRNFLSFHCPGFTKHRIVWSRSQDSPNTGGGTLNPLTWLWPRWWWRQLENWWKGGKWYENYLSKGASFDENFRISLKTKAGNKTGSICQDCKCTVHLHMETTGAVAWEPAAEKLPRTWKVRPAKYFKPGTSWVCDPLGPGHLWLETWELDPGTWGGKCLEPGSPRWETEGGSREVGAWYTWENTQSLSIQGKYKCCVWTCWGFWTLRWEKWNCSNHSPINIRQPLVVAAQNLSNILGTFSELQIWPHNWRWRLDMLCSHIVGMFYYFKVRFQENIPKFCKQENIPTRLSHRLVGEFHSHICGPLPCLCLSALACGTHIVGGGGNEWWM